MRLDISGEVSPGTCDSHVLHSATGDIESLTSSLSHRPYSLAAVQTNRHHEHEHETQEEQQQAPAAAAAAAATATETACSSMTTVSSSWSSWGQRCWYLSGRDSLAAAVPVPEAALQQRRNMLP